MLRETRNLLRLTEHAAGKYHTPSAYHRWATLSLLAAAAGDRVYLVRFRHAHLFPNLFVFLVGGSGLGKDHAIGFARSLVSPEAETAIQSFPGRLTQALLSDVLVYNQTRKDKAGSGAPIWLVQSELFADLPGGELTKALVADLVRLYQGSGSAIVLNATRMHGTRRVDRGPVINWLAGSTIEWFAKSITPDIFDSGFAGRSIFVCEMRNYEQRYAEPIYPDDHFEVVEHLVERIEHVVRTNGRFGVDARAAAIEREWVEGRPAPATDLEAKTWDRQHITSLKLAMLLVLCERTEPLIIEARHMAAAQRLVQEACAATALVALQVHQSREGAGWRYVEQRVRKAKKMDRATLVRELGPRGISAAALDELLGAMEAAGLIARGESMFGKRAMVEWVG